MFVGQNKIKSANRRHYQSLIKKKKPWATGILEEFGLNADALKIISFFGILFSYLPLLVYCISEELPFVEAAESFGSYVIVFVLLIMLFVSMFIVLFGFMRYARHEDEISKRVTIGNHKKIDFLKGNLFRVISLYTLGPVLVLAFFGFSMALDGYLILGMQLLFPATIGLLVFIPAFTLTLVYKYKDVSKLNNFLAVLNGTFFSAVAYFLVFWILFRLADVGGYFQDLDDRGQSAVILFVFFLTSVVFLFFTFVTTLNMKIHYGYIFTVSLVMVFGLLIQFDGAALFLGKRTMAVLKKGGDIPIVINVKKEAICSDVQKLNQLIFPKDTCSSEGVRGKHKAVASKTVYLALLTDKEVYIKTTLEDLPPEGTGKSPIISINRKEIFSIFFKTRIADKEGKDQKQAVSG